MENNYSLADLAAVTNGENGWGGNSIWLIILFIFIFGGGGLWGNRANAGAEYASTNEILSGQKFDAVSRQINQVGDGLSSSTYALNNAIKDGNSAVTSAIVGEGRALQTQLSNYQLASQQNVDAVRYDMATMANSINCNINDKFAALEKNQMQAQINAQASQINALQISAAVCGIPRVSTYAWGTYPYQAPSCCNCGTV